MSIDLIASIHLSWDEYGKISHQLEAFIPANAYQQADALALGTVLLTGSQLGILQPPIALQLCAQLIKFLGGSRLEPEVIQYPLSSAQIDLHMKEGTIVCTFHPSILQGGTMDLEEAVLRLLCNLTQHLHDEVVEELVGFLKVGLLIVLTFYLSEALPQAFEDNPSQKGNFNQTSIQFGMLAFNKTIYPKWQQGLGMANATYEENLKHLKIAYASMCQKLKTQGSSQECQIISGEEYDEDTVSEMALVKCPYCAEEINRTLDLCPFCERNLKTQIIQDQGSCPYCAEEIPPDTDNCPYCERQLKSKVENLLKEEGLDKPGIAGKPVALATAHLVLVHTIRTAFKEGKDYEAAKELDKVLELYVNEGNARKAMKLLEDLVAEFTNSISLHARVAEAYRAAGLLEKSLHHYEILFKLYLANSNFDKAKELINTFEILDPRSAEINRKLLESLNP